MCWTFNIVLHTLWIYNCIAIILMQNKLGVYGRRLRVIVYVLASLSLYVVVG